MITKRDMLESIKYVVDNSKYVSINTEMLEGALSLLHKNYKQSWLDTELAMKKLSKDKIMLYFILCESLNFCYWDTEVKWKVEYNGEWYSGSYGLFYAILKAVLNGVDLLNVDYLEKLTIEELDEILKGTTSIPLLKERFDIIKQLVQEIKDSDNFSEIFKANDDVELLNAIISNFQNFRDISLYKGKEIYFFKRAILLVGDLILNVEEINKNVENDNNMIGCADYKIPQVLRHLGILEYQDELGELIDARIQLEHDSEMEIEIRANMLYVIELIKEKLNSDGISMNSVQIDNALWLLSKNKEFKDKPHHLTKTIYY